MASLTGVYQALGVDMVRGFKLYMSLHGDKLGGHKVQLYVGDEGNGPATAVPVAKKFINDDHVMALTGVVDGSSFVGIAPLTMKAEIPLIGSNTGPSEPNVKWIWLTSWENADIGAAIAPYVQGAVKGPVFSIGPNYQGGYGVLGGFTDAFAKVGGHLANPDGKTLFTPWPEVADFTPYFTKIKQSGAKAVFAFYAGGMGIDFVKQYAKSSVANIPLYAAGYLLEGTLGAEGPAAAGIQSVLNYSPDLDNAANRTFISAWTSKYPGLPTVYAMDSYDSAMVLDEAIASAGDHATAATINDAIGKLGQIDSPRGPWVFSTTTHTPVQKWYLRQVRRDGRTLSNVLIQDLGTEGS